jgi:hypothetical protein
MYHLLTCYLEINAIFTLCQLPLKTVKLEAKKCRGGGMADAQDLKSCVALATCGFESHPRHISECGSVGRAPRLGRGGPRFESGHSD